MNGRRTWLAASAAALLVAGISATPAMASNLLDIGPRATLVARGVAVDVPLTYTCAPMAPWSMYNFQVRVTQVVRGQQVTGATAGVDPVCDGTPQDITVRVSVEPGAAAFKSGTGLVEAVLNTQDEFGEPQYGSTSEVVRIGR
jgi:hypothetical protein